MPAEFTIEHAAVLVGLSFFIGLAFEGFYLKSQSSRPGGIRTFPLIAITGGLLYVVEPRYLVPFSCGLIVLGFWLYPYYRAEVMRSDPGSTPADGIMVPVCNLLVYVLGPVVMTQPTWVAIGLTVLAVLLLRARERLHALAKKVPGEEIITLVQFLILTGIVLPLLPRTAVTALTPLTPFQVWLAVVVVCSISYASYLLQRYVSPSGSVFFAAVLGGMYSSTATTVVLARRLKGAASGLSHLQSGVVLSTAVMYLRLGLVIAIFNVPLALAIAPSLAAMTLIGVITAGVTLRWTRHRAKDHHGEAIRPQNPLELGAAVIFAAVFIVVSVLTVWIQQHLGSTGVYGLAAIVGVSDIDPFVLSLAHNDDKQGLSLATMSTAILVASSSNNLLKAVYTVSLGSWPSGRLPFLGLTILAVIGLLLAFFIV